MIEVIGDVFVAVALMGVELIGSRPDVCTVVLGGEILATLGAATDI